MDLGTKMKKPPGEFLYLFFSVTRLKIGLIEKNTKQKTLVLHKTASPTLGNPRENKPNVSKSRCHQNLSNTVYRIGIGILEKKIKFDKTDWTEGPK